MQAASRSATRRRCSTSRNARIPPSDDSRPPSNLTTTGLPLTDDKPGSGSIESFMAGVGFLKSRDTDFITQFLSKKKILNTYPHPPRLMSAKWGDTRDTTPLL